MIYFIQLKFQIMIERSYGLALLAASTASCGSCLQSREISALKLCYIGHQECIRCIIQYKAGSIKFCRKHNLRFAGLFGNTIMQLVALQTYP